jgi:TPR repeat protein
VGLQVPRSHKIALEWYHRAADQGNVEAQLKLSMVEAREANRKRIERQSEEEEARQQSEAAVLYFMEQAESGDADARYRYAQCLWYARAAAGESDKAAAITLLQLAARAGHGKAAWFLRQRTLEGDGSAVVAALGCASEAELKAEQVSTAAPA